MVPNMGKNHGLAHDEWTTMEEFDPYLSKQKASAQPNELTLVKNIQNNWHSEKDLY